MHKLTRAWSRLSQRRPTLPSAAEIPDFESDDDQPTTKAEVFQMFSKSRAAEHRRSTSNTHTHSTTGCSNSTTHPQSSAGNGRHSSPPKHRTRASESSIDVPPHLMGHTNTLPQLHQAYTYDNVHDKSAPNLQQTTYYDSSYYDPSNSVIHPTSSEDSYKHMHNVRHTPPPKNAINASVRSEGGEKVGGPSGSGSAASAKRRNSVFVKRGSVSMEPIKKVDLDDVYTVNKQLGTGRFGFIKLAEHKQSKLKIAIKFFPRPQTKQVDFIREYNYSFFLSPHQNIIDTYEGMYQTSNDSAFFFVQEFCPRASLREAVEATNQMGIGEAKTKQVFAAVMSAIEFMHDENLVHRNIKAENILIFDHNDFSKVKVTDFGLTRKVDATVKYLEYVNNYHAPELCETVVNEVLTVNKSTDVWALGVIFFYCLKGRFPWQKASIMCKPYWEWEQWLKRKNPTLPKKFNAFSEKSLKLLKKTLTPRVKDRWTAKELRKCVAKEKLLKAVKSKEDDHYYYIDMEASKKHSTDKAADSAKDENGEVKTHKKLTVQQWISTTLAAMAEISEQVVSARDD